MWTEWVPSLINKYSTSITDTNRSLCALTINSHYPQHYPQVSQQTLPRGALEMVLFIDFIFYERFRSTYIIIFIIVDGNVSKK